MTKPRKIGVLTFHKCINYGSYWQARCLVEGLRDKGFDAELIDHRCDRATRAELRCAFQPMLPVRSSRADMRAYGRKVRKFMHAFGHLPLSSPVSLHDPGDMPEYDAVVIGSDEVWNLSHPWYGGVRLFYGDGVRARKRLAYAGSFGSYSCHWGLDEFWTDRLKGFDALSVRDRNSYWLVNGTTGRRPPVVLDPCLQFADRIESRPAPDEEPFALVYGHSFPAWFSSAARRWAHGRGLRLRSVGYHNAFADEQVLDAGPLDFPRLMASARAVITNYFHGCVFALLNAKPFVVATTEYRQNKVRDLARAVGTERRLVDHATPQRAFDRLLATPPVPRVFERIGEMRRQSTAFLSDALA